MISWHMTLKASCYPIPQSSNHNCTTKWIILQHQVHFTVSIHEYDKEKIQLHCMNTEKNTKTALTMIIQSKKPIKVFLSPTTQKNKDYFYKTQFPNFIKWDSLGLVTCSLRLVNNGSNVFLDILQTKTHIWNKKQSRIMLSYT